MYPVNPSNLSLLPSPLDAKVIGGIRLFSLPVLLNVGTNLKFSEFTAGLTIEF